MWEGILDDLEKKFGLTDREAVWQHCVSGIPLGRPQSEEEIAAMVAYLVSPLAASITGQAVNVCGGMQMN